MNDIPVSKILVLDNNPTHARLIKQFCDAHHLVALKVRKGSEMSVLRTNIDLGGILFSEDYGASPDDTARIALAIHGARPELPIIIRRNMQATLTGLPGGAQQAFCAAYVASDMDALGKVIEEYIFCLMYPNALLRGIAEIAQVVLAGQFKKATISMDTPYIVHDRVIFGELFSLIQLESAWCRGYMMLQSEEDPLLALMDLDGAPGSADNFRRVNDLLSEITNLIWGSFKNRYIGDQRMSLGAQAQIPLVVNHKRKYISFGTVNPQLCFRFTLKDSTNGHSSTLYARFVFNLNWSPEDFREITHDVTELVESGELELF
ncbi:MAG: chemotaxis protein CheX [Steroidobacteraceae bacterium]